MTAPAKPGPLFYNPIPGFHMFVNLYILVAYSSNNNWHDIAFLFIFNPGIYPVQYN